MRTRLYLTHEDHGRALSWDEFLNANAEEGYQYEIIDGKAYVTYAPSASHESYAEWLSRPLYAYANQHPDVMKRVLQEPLVFVPNPNTTTFSRADIACYAECWERSAPNADWRDYSPVLVVEVLSEDDPDKDLVRNRKLYLQTPGIREYWVLDPREGVEGLTMLVHRRRGRRWAACRTVERGATYATPLLPGFSLVLDPHAG